MIEPIQKHAGNSKKFTVGLIGTGAVMFVYATGLVAIYCCEPSKAQHILGLANIAVVFLGAICGSLITGQSFVDWKHGSTTTESDSDAVTQANVNKRTEIVTQTISPKQFDDGTVD